MALTGNAGFTIGTSFTDPLDLSTPTDSLTKRFTNSIVDGVAIGQANKIFHDRRVLASGANEDIDLNGSLLDAFGNQIDLLRVKFLAILNDPDGDASSDENLEVKPATVNGWNTWVNASADTVIIPPGFGFFLGGLGATAYPVTAATADLLNIAAAGGGSVGIKYDIVIIGADA